MSAPRDWDELAAEIEERLGYSFQDRTLLATALTHASALRGGAVRGAERLEFLGDAVLDLAVADLLLTHFSDWDEGQLSKARARIVRGTMLAAKSDELRLGEVLRLGRGEEHTGGRAKSSILAATYEAVLGAIFQDGGFGRARAVVARHLSKELLENQVLTPDFKTLLQERTQAVWKRVPEYRVVEEQGPAHARRFVVEVRVQGRLLGTGEGPSKRDAAQRAAAEALGRLSELEVPPG